MRRRWCWSGTVRRSGPATAGTPAPATSRCLDDGEADARALGARLQRPFGLVLTSPLQRAARTAELAGLTRRGRARPRRVGLRARGGPHHRAGPRDPSRLVGVGRRRPRRDARAAGRPPAAGAGRASRRSSSATRTSASSATGTRCACSPPAGSGSRPRVGQQLVLGAGSLSVLGHEHGSPAILTLERLTCADASAPAEPADVPVLLELVHELAVYEREPDAVEATEDMLAARAVRRRRRSRPARSPSDDGRRRRRLRPLVRHLLDLEGPARPVAGGPVRPAGRPRHAGSARRCCRSSPASASRAATPASSGGCSTGTPRRSASTARSARCRRTSGRRSASTATRCGPSPRPELSLRRRPASAPTDDVGDEAHRCAAGPPRRRRAQRVGEQRRRVGARRPGRAAAARRAGTARCAPSRATRPSRTVAAHALNSSAAAPCTTALRAKRPGAGGQRDVLPERLGAARAPDSRRSRPPYVRRSCAAHPGRLGGAQVGHRRRVGAVQVAQGRAGRARRSGRTSPRGPPPWRSAGRSAGRLRPGRRGRPPARPGRARRRRTRPRAPAARPGRGRRGRGRAPARRARPGAARPAGCAARPRRSCGPRRRRTRARRRAAARRRRRCGRASAQPYVVAVRSALRQRSSAATAGEVAACGSRRQDRVSGRSKPARASSDLHLRGRAQVDRRAGEAAQHLGVALAARARRRRRRRRARPEQPGQQRLDDRAVERQAVALELDGEQRRRRLRPGRQDRQRRRARSRPRVGQRPQQRLLRRLRLQRQLGPPLRVLGPGAAQPLAAELAVGRSGAPSGRRGRAGRCRPRTGGAARAGPAPPPRRPPGRRGAGRAPAGRPRRGPSRCGRGPRRDERRRPSRAPTTTSSGGRAA